MAKIKFTNILFNFLAILTILAVGFTLFNIFSGAKAYAVTSESMNPTLKRGDAVFSKTVEFENLKVGDIVTVRVGKNEGYFTHRIVAIDKDKQSVKTKGDNNNSVDPMDTEAERIVGKMWYSMPLLGFPSLIFSGVSLVKILIILVVIACAIIALNIIIEKKQKRRGDSNE